MESLPDVVAARLLAVCQHCLPEDIVKLGAWLGANIDRGVPMLCRTTATSDAHMYGLACVLDAASKYSPEAWAAFRCVREDFMRAVPAHKVPGGMYSAWRSLNPHEPRMNTGRVLLPEGGSEPTSRRGVFYHAAEANLGIELAEIKTRLVHKSKTPPHCPVCGDVIAQDALGHLLDVNDTWSHIDH